MAVISPFKFLDSYSEEDRDIFFGRDLEIEEVYNKVFQDKTLFIYGESGTGKSSLINCGLANKFKETDWLPIHVRRGDSIIESLIYELDRLVLTPVNNLNGSFSKNLFKYTRSIYLDYFKPIYFIFDQFEELYLLGSRDEWKEFITGIKSLVDRDIQVHFIFIIRSEYLHFMSEFEKELPEIFNNKLRVEKITRMKARECIEGPCKVSGIQVEEGFSELLFNQLSPDKSEIELTYLQVYLDRIYKRAKNQGDNGSIVFSKNLLYEIGRVSDVLADFLDEQIDSMPNKEASLLVLKSFVTVQGTKKQASIEDIRNFSKSLGKPLESDLIKEQVAALLERRILKELQDSDKYELRHDTLAHKIYEKITIRERELIEVRQFLDYALAEYKKRGFILNDRDLVYIKPHLDTLDLTEDLKEFVDESIKNVGKKRRFRKRVIGIIIIILALSISSLWGYFYAQNQKKLAVEQKTLAEKSALEAQKQKEIAEQNADNAIQSQRNAELNANEATIQGEIAEQQRLIADMQRAVADSNRIEAEKQKLLALIQKDSAESARERALFYLSQANAERERAEKLSMQSLARSLGIKAAQLPDLELKSLLALQAYKFNKKFDGYQYQADIYNGLYQAYKQIQGQEINEFKGHTASITDILNSNGIYTTGSDGKIIYWNDDLTKFRVLANTGMINNTMAISPDNSKMAIGTASSTIFIYDVASGNVISRYAGHRGEVWQILFQDNQTLLSSGEDKKILQWNLNSGERVEIDSDNYNAQALALQKTLGKLVIGMDDGRIFELDLSSLSKVEVGGRTGDMVTQLTFNHNNTFLVVGYESGTIQLLNPSTYEIIETLPGHTARVTDLKFNKDDKFLISGGFDRKSLIWNLDRIKEQPITLTDHDSFVWAVGFTISGSEVITGELNGMIKKYKLEMNSYADIICDRISRNLTIKEWQSFVPENIPYEMTCLLHN